MREMAKAGRAPSPPLGGAGREGPPAQPILAIETSCDDTCAAVVDWSGRSLASVVSSQVELHDRFGGVVPEVASRRHLELVNHVVDEALALAGAEFADIGRIAVTCGPGLIGALLVGVSAAKALACARELPFVPVNHLHGHMAACFLEPDPLPTPFLCLIASGGHTLLAEVKDHLTYEVLGEAIDDAAGEALDKGARLLGLPFPGGAELDRLARLGDPDAFDLPAGMRRSLDFSFSGVKTALVYRVRDLGEDRARECAADLAASYERAVCDQLVDHIDRALRSGRHARLALGGGVAANSSLRRRAAALAEVRGVELKILPPALCTDNAAMIGSAARYLPAIDFPQYLGFQAFAASPGSGR